jgi:hypothetical protein
MSSPYLDIDEVMPAEFATPALASAASASLAHNILKAFEYETNNNKEANKKQYADWCFARDEPLHVPTGPQQTADSDFRWVTLGFDKFVTRTLVMPTATMPDGSGDGGVSSNSNRNAAPQPGAGIWSVQ